MTTRQARELLTKSQTTILVDTREKQTNRYEQRISSLQYPHQRAALQTGDYSVMCSLPNGTVLNLTNRVVIERKASLDELCSSLSSKKDASGNSNRDRFYREMERARTAGIKVYLLIETPTGRGWEEIAAHSYRSQYDPDLLMASILSLMVMYDVTPLFAKAENTGRLISKILHQHLKFEICRCYTVAAKGA